MSRQWTDDEVELCARGMVKIVLANLDGERGGGLNQSVKQWVSTRTGRPVSSVRTMMRRVARVLEQRGLGVSDRNPPEPSAAFREQIERVLDRIDWGAGDLMTPSELSSELGVPGKRIRQFLREEYSRSDSEKHERWFLDRAQVAAVRARFGGA